MYKEIVSDLARQTGYSIDVIDNVLKSYLGTYEQLFLHPEYRDKGLPHLGILILYKSYPSGISDLVPEHRIMEMCADTYEIDLGLLATVLSAYKMEITRHIAEGNSLTLYRLGRFTFKDGRLRFYTSDVQDFKGRILGTFRKELNAYIERGEHCKERLTELVG